LWTTKYRIAVTLACSGTRTTGEPFVSSATTEKLVAASERLLMAICPFKEKFGEVLPESLETIGEALREVARTITFFDHRQKEFIEVTKQELVDLKNTLQSSNTTISEIAGDVANLKNLADTNSAKVNDLQTKLADALAKAGVANDPELDAIVADLKNIADAQHNTLGSIAESVPGMPVGPGTPGDVPTPNPTPAPVDNGGTTPVTPTPVVNPTPTPTPDVNPAPTTPVTPPDVQAPGTVVTPTPAPADNTNPAAPVTPDTPATPTV
jgi:hypothetical protein